MFLKECLNWEGMGISSCLGMALPSCPHACFETPSPYLCNNPSFLPSPSTSLRQPVLRCSVAAGMAVAGDSDDVRWWLVEVPGEAVEPTSLFHLVLLPPVLSMDWTIWQAEVSFTTFGCKSMAVKEELVQEHIYLPVVLVQDSGFIPSSVMGFMPPHLLATELQLSIASSWLSKNPLGDLCLR